MENAKRCVARMETPAGPVRAVLEGDAPALSEHELGQRGAAGRGDGCPPEANASQVGREVQFECHLISMV
jgi:hypothetical protein